uniref:Ubiquitin-like protease family profile domain-containing protein n=1 Tax=Oryza rufipogon TaxID=4529 RepID=A0A0E0QXF4_ORYRU
MTLNDLEQPDLTCWLMDRTNPKSMTIDISENKKIVITPWMVKTVLGVPLGGDPLQLPDQDIMSDALSDLAIELDLPPKLDITASRLIEEIKNRPKDRTTVRYFIMVIINKMLLPSTGLYIRPKDAWIGSDLNKVARINWSKAVFDALCDSVVLWHKNKTGPRPQTYIRCCVAFLVLLYIDNLKVPKDSFIVDRCETPRIQLYTKHLVEDISQEDRVTDPSGNYVFGNLPMNGIILGSCYSHPNYDKEKEPCGDNSGTPFAGELISAVEISFPSMFDTVYPHLSGLQDEHKQRVLDALGEYDRQSKLSADAIAKQIRLVQTCHARASDHIISIIRGESRTQPPLQPQPQPISHSQPDSQQGPIASPIIDEAQDHHTHSTPDTPPTNSPAPQPSRIRTLDAALNATPHITSTEPHSQLPGELFPTMDKTATGDETQVDTPQPDADFQRGSDVGISMQGILAITMTSEGTYRTQSHTGDGTEGHHDLPDADVEHGIEINISMQGNTAINVTTEGTNSAKSHFGDQIEGHHHQPDADVEQNSDIDIPTQGIIQPTAPAVDPALPDFGVPNTLLALMANVQDDTPEHNMQEVNTCFSSPIYHSYTTLSPSYVYHMQVNKEADDGAEQHVSPVKHCVKKAGRYVPPASQTVPKDDNVAIQLLDLILSDPTKFGRFIPFLPISCTLQLHNCFISIQPHLLTQSNIIPHSPPLIEVDCHSVDATNIAASFKVGSMTEGIFIDAFASLLFKDEMRDNPETFGKKIFIPTSVSYLINIENVTRLAKKDEFSPHALVEHLSECLKHVDFSKAEQFLLPIINNDHWTPYIV